MHLIEYIYISEQLRGIIDEKNDMNINDIDEYMT